MKTIQKKSLTKPDEKREFSKGQVEVVTIGDVTFGKGTFLPGWKWSESVKPIVKTESCLAPHTQYHISGRLHVKMDDGTEMEYGPGDFGVVPPGHDEALCKTSQTWLICEAPFSLHAQSPYKSGLFRPVILRIRLQTSDF
jgi:ethanolamine utilization protein EutQ (cupin superfamily)